MPENIPLEVGKELFANVNDIVPIKNFKPHKGLGRFVSAKAVIESDATKYQRAWIDLTDFDTATIFEDTVLFVNGMARVVSDSLTEYLSVAESGHVSFAWQGIYKQKTPELSASLVNDTFSVVEAIKKAHIDTIVRDAKRKF